VSCGMIVRRNGIEIAAEGIGSVLWYDSKEEWD
jgi:hypothetical protein